VNTASWKQKQKRKKEGRCRDCSKPLNDELDGGHVTCLNCRLKCRRPRWVTYGTYQKESPCQP
jgi:hypothetical protein